MIEATNVQPSGNWQQPVLEKLLLETLNEQKRKRRWGIFFKLIYLFIIIIFFCLLFNYNKLSSSALGKPHTALVNIKGEIFSGANASADNIVTGLTKAFKDSNTRGVILRINSPGGSPVQASYVFNEIMRLKAKYPKIKVYAVCSDVCASAAYYIASAADNIYADPASLVGSIGVLMDGFGFVDTLQKLGVERRLITAGSEKGFLDPFSPMSPQDHSYAQTMLNTVHQQFIAAVKRGRGSRLKNSPELFSGLAWTGEQALQLGLIDGYGSAGYVAREIIKNTNVVDYTKKSGLFSNLGKQMGTAFYHHFAEQMGFEGIKLR
jgi:protease-4